MRLQPIATNFTLKDHIYDTLRDAITAMDIYAEDTDLRLDERSIAEQLGISRTPLREALARLEKDGLITIVPRKGVYVVRKSLEEILDMIVAWAALESMAARMAATNATDKDMQKLRKHAMSHSADAARADLSEYSDANIQFHAMILQMSGSKLLADMADGLFVHMHAVRRRAMGEGNRASRSVVDHMSIILALEARDPDLAEDLVREHTLRLHDHIRRAWARLETLSKMS